MLWSLMSSGMCPCERSHTGTSVLLKTVRIHSIDLGFEFTNSTTKEGPSSLIREPSWACIVLVEFQWLMDKTENLLCRILLGMASQQSSHKLSGRVFSQPLLVVCSFEFTRNDQSPVIVELTGKTESLLFIPAL